MATTLPTPAKNDFSSFVEKVRSFVATEVLPNTRRWEANQAFPDDIWKKLGSLGVLRMTASAEDGGVDCVTYTEACLEFAKGDPALAMNIAAINALCVAHFDAFSTP